ncbi:hypothetical protein EBS80_02685 [bacterium]|nr:hypothetical protein [bacterium]
MSRAFALLALFLCLAILQTSFFASLPGVLAYTPFVLASGIYLAQHVGQRFGAYVVAGIGLWVSLLGISTFPAEWVASAAAGATAYLSARHIFSNRSWYGLTACGALTVAAWGGTQAVLLGLTEFRHPEAVSWQAFFAALCATFVLNEILLTVFFSAAKPIREFLGAAFLVSRDRESL